MIKIKPIELTDADALYGLIEDNRTYLKENFPVTIAQIKDIQSAMFFVDAKVEERNNKLGYYFIIYYQNTPCGILSIKNVDWRTPKAELAYFVDEKSQGKKIATESVKQAIDYCFHDLKLLKLYACVDPGNIGSKKVVIKNNFILEGILKKNFRNGFGEIKDSEYYGLLNISL